MPAAATLLRGPVRPHDPAPGGALAELTQLGLAVARVAARLAEVEDEALDAVAGSIAASGRALAEPPASLGDALRAGREADASEAAREAAVARVAVITECFDKAARAVRRSVALQARLASGRAWAELTPPVAVPPVAAPFARREHPAPGATASRSRPGSDAEPAERPDRAEGGGDGSGDELGGRTDEEVLRDIRRDLAGAGNITRLDRQAGATGAGTLPLPVPASPAPGSFPDDEPGVAAPSAPSRVPDS